MRKNNHTLSHEHLPRGKFVTYFKGIPTAGSPAQLQRSEHQRWDSFHKYEGYGIWQIKLDRTLVCKPNHARHES